MTVIHCKLPSGEYPIFIKAGCLTNINLWQKYINNNKVAIITSNKVAGLYLKALKQSLAQYNPEIIIVEDGEQTKTIDNFYKIINWLLSKGYDRNTTLISLGGGTISDLTGFVASCYLRGVDLIQVPTTLLAQVDASVGGKNGINCSYGKNLIGTFYQPKAIFIDTETLATLDIRDFTCGLAEIIKYSLVSDADFYLWLQQNIQAIYEKNNATLYYMISKTINIKLSIISQDEQDRSIRAICNFGHSFGHAIEKYFHFKKYLHGEAVAVGMCIAANISCQRGYLLRAEVTNLVQFLASLQLPVHITAELNIDKLIYYMKADKKNKNGNFNIILLDSIGKARIWRNITTNNLQQHLTRCLLLATT